MRGWVAAQLGQIPTFVDVAGGEAAAAWARIHAPAEIGVQKAAWLLAGQEP